MSDAIAQYFALLQKWNQRMNLTAVRSWEDFEERHLRDAEELAPLIGDARTLIDLGCGAGVPGILLKILRPECHVTLLDATRKKVAFCEAAIRDLGLAGISAEQGRAEGAAEQGRLGTFDAVVSRATWALRDYLAVARPYCRSGGALFALKGPRCEEELEAAAEIIISHGYNLRKRQNYTLAGVGGARTILCFEIK